MKQRYGYQHLGNQLGTMIGALMNGDAYERQGQLAGRDKLGDILLKEARAAEAQAKADQARQRMAGAQTGRQDFLRGQTGLVDPQLAKIKAFSKDGNWGHTELMGPPNPGQRSMPEVPNPAPEWYTPDVANRYNRALSTLGANAVATGDTNAAQLGTALAKIAETGNIDAMIAGDMDPARAAAAYGAADGKPVYSQGSQGVLHNYTGDTQTTPRLGAEIAALTALAGQRDAAADANTALAEQRRNPATSSGQPPAVVATLEYLQKQMNMSPKQALVWMQTAKLNPVKAALDLASKRYAADAEAAAASFGETPMPDFDTYLQEAQVQVQQLLNPVAPDAGTDPGAMASDDPLGLLQ